MRAAISLFAVLVALLLAVPAAHAAEVGFLPAVKRTLKAAPTTKARCDAGVLARRGVRRTVYRAPMAGYATVRLRSARRSDWDLAVFDGRGRRVGASMAFGSSEVVQKWVGAGDRLTIQGCHRAGKARRARVSVVLADLQLPSSAVAGTPQLVQVAYDDQADLERIEALGLDLTHHIHDGKADVIVANAQQRALLVDEGFEVTTEIADLAAHYRRSRMADARYTVAAGEDGSDLPSGRTTYRVLTDYQADMKRLADEYPDIVKPMTLPQRSYQGRPLDGLEIAKDVRSAPEDGRPVYFVVALHHAREWPSAEAAMEFAIELAEGYGKRPEITKLLTDARVVIVPLINPDGFVSSRGFPADPADVLGGGGDHAGVGVDPNTDDPCAGSPAIEDPALAEVCAELRTCLLTGGDPGDPCESDLYLIEGISPPGGIFSYRRKNCAGAIPNPSTPCEAQYGVDPNRNYGQFWGGPGSDADPSSQSYRGPAPWSEPETQAVHEYSQRRQITSIITIHNVAALILRPPGTSGGGKAPDEERLKEIGDAMAVATGYKSQYGFELYDTAGTTEDWNYAAAGTYGYTIEIGPPGGEFHMPYETGVVKEYLGTSETAEGRGGLAKALLLAGEAAANPGDHAVITGKTRPGRILRVRKDFTTPSWDKPFCRQEIPLFLFNVPATDGPRCVETAQPFEVEDFLESTLEVPASGRFEWHVNPSTRPFVLKDKVIPGELVEGEPDIRKGSGEPNPSVGTTESVEEFEVSDDATQRLVLDLTWTVTPEDFDLYLCYEVSETECTPVGQGKTDTGESGSNPGTFEQIVVEKPAVGTYRATINHFATAADDYTLTARYFTAGETTVIPGRREAWILTCETPAGEVLQRTEVVVDRGQVASVNLARCSRNGGPPAHAPASPPKGGPGSGSPRAGGPQAGTPEAGGGRADRRGIRCWETRRSRRAGERRATLRCRMAMERGQTVKLRRRGGTVATKRMSRRGTVTFRVKRGRYVVVAGSQRRAVRV